MSDAKRIDEYVDEKPLSYERIRNDDPDAEQGEFREELDRKDKHDVKRLHGGQKKAIRCLYRG